MNQTLKLKPMTEERFISKKMKIKQQPNYMKETSSSMHKKHIYQLANTTTNKPIERKDSFVRKDSFNTSYLRQQTNTSFSKKKSFTLNNALDPYGHFDDIIVMHDPYGHFT
jgi:hypothetical protein